MVRKKVVNGGVAEREKGKEVTGQKTDVIAVYCQTGETPWPVAQK